MIIFFLPLVVLILVLLICRHKTRLHIGQLVKDTSAKLKQASDTDHHTEVSVSFAFMTQYY